MKNEFKKFTMLEMKQAAKLTEKYECAVVNGYLLNEVYVRVPESQQTKYFTKRIASKEEKLSVLQLLAKSKFGCPAATCLMVKLQGCHETVFYL